MPEKFFIQPVGNKLICEIIKKEDFVELDSGLILKESKADDDVDYAIVKSIGPGEPDRNGVFMATTTQPGQKIAIAKFSGQCFHIKGKEYMIMREYEILGTVED